MTNHHKDPNIQINILIQIRRDPIQDKLLINPLLLQPAIPVVEDPRPLVEDHQVVVIQDQDLLVEILLEEVDHQVVEEEDLQYHRYLMEIPGRTTVKVFLIQIHLKDDSILILNLAEHDLIYPNLKCHMNGKM